MTELQQFEDELRAMMAGKESAVAPTAGFAERLLATPQARPPRTLHRVDLRRVPRWTPPLLVAAAVAIVAIVASAVSSSPSAHKPSPGTSRPVPKVSSPPIIHGKGAPPGFVVHGMQFLDADNGYALGNATCAAKAHICPTLLRTSDGGGHWTQLGVPSGIVPVDDANDPSGGGSCSTNGGIRGPCVDEVLFVDAMHGYLWSHNFFYWTTDGGTTWRNGHSRADNIVHIGTEIFRARPVADCSTCTYRIERATAGTDSWQDVTPGHRDRFGVTLVAAGGTLYASVLGINADRGGLYRSSNLGASWQTVSWPKCGPSRNAASDGSLACWAMSNTQLPSASGGTVRAVSPSGVLGSPRALPTHFGPGDLYLTQPGEYVVYGSVPTGALNSPLAVYWSGDAGRTWKKALQFSSQWYSLGYFAGSRGFLVTIWDAAANTYTTSDGGRTWHRYEFS